jgi:UDP-glucose 6-dehydrogenase
LERIEDITYSVFERFSIFQFIGKNPKINKFFFDEKSSKIFRVSNLFLSGKISFVNEFSSKKSCFFSMDLRIPEVGW